MAPTDLGDWYDYFIPETWNPADLTGVLKNRLGAATHQQLSTREGRAVVERQRELQEVHDLVPRSFDAPHLQAIHAHLFQDVYDWAGEYRIVDISKDGMPFAAHEHDMGTALNRAADRAASTEWQGLDRDGFVESISAVFADLNYAHPFREGNGRTTRVFLQQVSEKTSFVLDFTKISREVWNQRSMFSSPDKGSVLPHPEEMHPVFSALTRPS